MIESEIEVQTLSDFLEEPKELVEQHQIEREIQRLDDFIDSQLIEKKKASNSNKLLIASSIILGGVTITTITTMTTISIPIGIAAGVVGYYFYKKEN